MSEPAVEQRLSFAIQLAKQAGDLARRGFRMAGLDIVRKSDGDPVTGVDLAIDMLIRAEIGRAFPNDGVLSEETGGPEARTLWIVDPIDGTRNFARGVARFAVSIAICQDGIPTGGVIHDPMADETFSARRGSGAFLDGAPIRVSDVREAEGTLIEAGYSSKHGWRPYHDMTGRLLAAGFEPRQCGSAALGLAEIACGRIDGYCERHLESWDVAAGALIVTEAGGRVSDFPVAGEKAGGPIVAAAAGIWRQLVEAAAITPEHSPHRSPATTDDGVTS